MKRKIMPIILALPLCAYLFANFPSHDTVTVAAIDPPWIEEATPLSGESYDYQMDINPTTLVTANPTYPSLANTESTFTTINTSPIMTTNSYIGINSMVRDDYMTLDT